MSVDTAASTLASKASRTTDLKFLNGKDSEAMSLTQLSAWRMATEFEPKIPLRVLRELTFDLHCGCGTGFLKRTIEHFPIECTVCGRRVDGMRVSRSRK